MLMNRKIPGEYREFYPDREGLPMMKDYLEDHPYPGQGKNIFFLMHGVPGLVGMKPRYDVFTGERISSSKTLLRYKNLEWWEDLAYYVKNYNLRLPREVESFILSINPKEIYEYCKQRKTGS